MGVKTEIDIEALLRWAFVDELGKRQLSAAEGIWSHIEDFGHLGGTEIRGHGTAQRYAHFGLPDPDAETIEREVSALKDVVIDWRASFATIAGDLGALVTVNDVAPEPKRQPKSGWGEAGARAVRAFFGPGADRPPHDRPRDVLMVGGLRTAVLVASHAIKGTRPDWCDEAPKPSMVPALKGPNAMIVGECKGRNLYTAGSYCPLQYDPSPLSILLSRADYVAWHHGLVVLAERLNLKKFTPLPPSAPPTPWIENTETAPEVKPVLPDGKNSVKGWGTLPLKPARGRVGPPLRTPKAGPVKYPLEAAS